jgi:molecular chaperone DnaJ
VTVRREWLEKDYYADLGVGKDASAKDIKRAYRKLAQEYHPDTTQGDEAKEAKFKEVNEAYSVLSDDQTRTEYDQARDAFASGAYSGGFPGGPGGPGGSSQYVTVEDLGDLFGGGGGGGFFGGLGDLFGRGGPMAQPGADLEAEVSLSFHEAISGATRSLTTDTGRSVQVKIPAGINDGARIRVTGKGSAGANGGPPGDLYVRIRAASHPVFGRSGADLKLDVPITFTEATLGAKITVPTLDGSVTLRIPEGTPSGKRFRVTGKGVVTPKTTGDLIVTVTITVPKDLTDEQRALLEKLHANDSDNPRDHLGV